MAKLKVAIVHDYLVQYGGAEKTLEALCEIYPDAPIYTGIYKPKLLSEFLNSRDIRTTANKNNLLLGKLPKHFTFLMPTLFEGFDLSEYDIVISEGTTWAKSILTKPHQLHISYMHTPPRFLYKYSVESLKRYKWYYKPFVAYLENYLRVWDYTAAQRPDYIVANSEEIKKRIQKFYRREAKVIYPPTEINAGLNGKYNKDNLDQSYYVILGRMSAYKNVDLVIEAFNLLGYNLTVMGTGIEEKKLKSIAKDNIKFMGRVTEEKKHEILEHCLGVIYPIVEEDFGIVPIEAMSHGKPTLAHRSGGPLGTIREGKDGMFFDYANVECIVENMKLFDESIRKGMFNAQDLKERAKTFSKERFQKEFNTFVIEKWNQHNARITRSPNNSN